MNIDLIFQILSSLLFLGYIFFMFKVSKKEIDKQKPEDHNNIPVNLENKHKVRLKLLSLNIIAMSIFIVSFLLLSFIKSLLV